MRRPTKSSTAIRCWAGSRRQAIRTRYARPGGRCAKRERLQEPCSWRQRQIAGMWIRRRAARKAVKCFTRPQEDVSHMANSLQTLRGCPSPKMCHSNARGEFKLIGTPAKRLDTPAKVNTKEIAEELEKAILNSGPVAQNIGDVDKALASAVTKVEATYELPFLAHATMEPMNCTVHVRKDGCEVWVGSQAVARVQAAAAKTAGLPLDKVLVHNHLIGGGFGRRLESDGVIRAVQIAQHVDGPVKVVWTREEDIQHDMHRPYWFDRLSAGLDEKGMPIAWNHRFAGSSVLARWAPPFFRNGLDPDTTEGAINLVYALPNLHVEYLQVEPPGIPTAFCRSVGPSHNVFVTESFIDELAAAAKQDPVAYRRTLLDKTPRAKAVLDLAAEKAGWGQPLPEGVARGVSLQFVFATYMAQIAEVEVSKDGSVRVRRVVCAVDCGTVVNPDTVRAQIEGAIIFGITAALYGEITLKDGRVEQTNFDTYQA